MCAVATEKLQGKTETMVDALETVKTLSDIVSNRPEHPYPDEIWNCIWSEAVELTTLCEFPVLPAHRIRSVRRAKGKHVGNFEGPDDYRRRLFLPLCNTLAKEFDRRFMNHENRVVRVAISSVIKKRTLRDRSKI